MDPRSTWHWPPAHAQGSVTRAHLLALLQRESCLGEVDFLYLPMDVKTGRNTGFALVNTTSNAMARRLRNHFSGFSRWGVRALRHCNVCWAKEVLQGFVANVERYRSVVHSAVAAEHKPMVLAHGVELCFPQPSTMM